MRWTEKQLKIAELVLSHRNEESKSGYDLPGIKTDMPEGFLVTEGEISKVAKELRGNDWQIPGDDGDNGTPLSVVKVKGAPVKFSIKGEEILLSADDLFTAYFIYLDMRERLELEDSFSEAMVTGFRTVWSLTQIPVIEKEGGEVKCQN